MQSLNNYNNIYTLKNILFVKGYSKINKVIEYLRFTHSELK